MKKFRRIAALLLAVALMAAMLSGCAIKPYVMKIDHTKVRQGIYGYYYGYCYAAYYDDYGEDYVNYYAMTSIFQHVAVNQLFDQYGFKLTDEEKANAEKAREDKITDLGSQAAYASFLKTCGLTDSLYLDLLYTSQKYNRLYDYLYGEGGSEYLSEQDVRDAYKENFVHETYIYLSTTDIETEAERQAIYDEAVALHERAMAGEDFIELVRQYTQIEYLQENPDKGYYVTDGDITDTTLNDAVMALEVDQISDVIEASDGFYIVKRLEVGDDMLDDLFEDGTAYTDYCSQMFQYYLMDIMTDYQITYYDAYYEVNWADCAAVFEDSTTSS